ncbi:hypothetical protein ACFYOV_21880 [Streptomyces sp. NPDC005931]|uniref:hypothetical protein n=1 Tax=Streptomyces sp. NPDC005931 TaxID=3364737 RepID=UPI00367A0151
MSRALPRHHRRRVALAGGTAALALSGTVITGFALAGEQAGSPGGGAQPGTPAGPGTIACRDVASRLPAVPASAHAEVDRNLALLDRQIHEADKHLTDTVGQGGPDFVQNAVLGPLKDRRTAAIDRIAIAIDRTADRPPDSTPWPPARSRSDVTGTVAAPFPRRPGRPRPPSRPRLRLRTGQFLRRAKYLRP